MWVFTFWIANDATSAVVFFNLARDHGWFPFLTATFVALVVWLFFEFLNLYLVIKLARQEIWGKYYSSPVSFSQGVLRVTAELVFMFAALNLLRVYMDDDVLAKCFTLTNVAVVAGPAYLWNERKSREGASVGLAILIVFIMIFQILPPGFGYNTTVSSYFDQPWFYISGITFVALAIRNVQMLLRFPPKKSLPGFKTIW